MGKIKFKTTKVTEELILTNASVPVAKGVYLSGWLITDNGEKIDVIPPYVSDTYTNNGKSKYKYCVLRI